MRWTPRVAAAVTVLGTLPFIPCSSPDSQKGDLLPERTQVREARSASHVPIELAAGWSSNLMLHLRTTRSLTVEVEELRAMLGDVASISKRFDLDPLLVLAVIHVESGYDPFAISPAGSVGLMQLQVDTARDVATRLDIPWTTDDLLFDPRVNVLLGTCYLKELLDRFGDEELALAAFHSGPSRIAGHDLSFAPAAAAYAERVRVVLHELEARVREPRYS